MYPAICKTGFFKLGARARIVLGAALALLLLSSTLVRAEEAPAVPAAAAAAPETATGSATGVEEQGTANTGLPKRIVRPMIALDPVTLKAEGQQIRLWGIKPAQTAETPIELKALDMMDRLIGQEPVNCRIMTWHIEKPVAKCDVHTNEDIALVLLQNGFVVVDRAQTYNSVLASAYFEAQEQARVNRRGVWKLVIAADKESVLPEWIEKNMEILMPVMLLFGPLVGFAFVGWIANRKLGAILEANEREYEYARKKEASLEARERLVMVSSLESELDDNRAKLEAFLTIYREMLRSMKDPAQTPKYQQGGDLVHQHPALSRVVFDGNVDKLGVLELKLAGEVSKLYSAIHASPDYVTLDPTLPLETAVEMVERVVMEAESVKIHLDMVLSQLRQVGMKNAPAARKRPGGEDTLEDSAAA